MILLASNCLLVRLAGGESVPLRPDMISIEVTGQTAEVIDSEFINHVAAAVFHYFKHELGRDSVSLAEFSETLELVLREFALKAKAVVAPANQRTLETDLSRIVRECGGTELFFFPKLREELRARLLESPRLLRFSGLRGCVKALSGARRWSDRCRDLEDQIVDFLRGCFAIEPQAGQCALVVE